MMREFSSAPHRKFIATWQGERVRLVNISRVNLAILVAAILAGGVVLDRVGASLRTPEPTPSPTTGPSTPSPIPSASLAAADVAGEDIERLPRYPGSVRSVHEVSLGDRYRLTVNEYHAAASVDDARTFYQGIIAEYGWERADIEFNRGEWSYVLVSGSVEALVEIEDIGGLVEIDLQISEPIVTPSPQADPTPAPTAAPVTPPPPPPPPPPPGDDDGGDDDDDGDTDD